jgi:chorismate mutase
MKNLSIRAIRGATTCDVDSPEEIANVSVEVVRAMLERNAITGEDVISIFFTTTPDLTSSFPATAVRLDGFAEVPLMCASEIAVPSALPRVIRVMMHAYTTADRKDVRHVYLRGAVVLRSDLD